MEVSGCWPRAPAAGTGMEDLVKQRSRKLSVKF